MKTNRWILPVAALLVGFGADKPFFAVDATERATMNAAPPTVKF